MSISIGGQEAYSWQDGNRSLTNGASPPIPAYRAIARVESYKIPTDTETYIPGDLVIENGNGAVYYSHSPLYKGRGNTTWGQPKKPFKVRSLDKLQRPFGYAPSRDWAFMADAFDPSYLRTSVSFEWARRATGRWAPWSHHIWLIWNGVDQGLYRYSETCDLQVGRVDFRKMKDSDISGNKLTGPYFLEIDEIFDDPGFRSALNTPVMYDTPDVVGITQQEAYIKGWVDNMEDTIIHGTEHEILDVIDLDSWADWYVLQEFVRNVDSTYFKSIKWVKDQDSPDGTGKAILWPPWDFDRTIGIGAGDTDGWTVRSASTTGPTNRPNILYYAWERSSAFRTRCRERWDENFKPAIDGAIEYMYGLNDEIAPWIASDRALWYGGTAQGSTNTVAGVESWIRSRKTWFDANL
jgi:hypothetical protein